jgi:hypothetical protein
LDEEKMAKSHNDMIEWIKDELAKRAKAENNDIAQVVTQEVNGTRYSFGLTADSGFFKIVITPASDFTDQQLPLVLVFSFRDLYLLGFFHGTTWYLFDDANLEGSGHLAHPDAYQLLGFEGSYVNSHFASAELSNYYLFQSYDSLTHYPERSRNEIMVAVFRYLVVIPEPCRFPQWHSHLQWILKNVMSVTTDSDFATWFQNWSTICKKARRGAARFVARPGDFFATFESLLQTIDGGVALSRPPADQL